MIRYADERDFDVLRVYDTHMEALELKKSIGAKRIFIMRSEQFIGWLRFHLFWDSIPFMNMLYLLEDYRGKGYGKQLVDFWEKEMRGNQYKMVMTSTRAILLSEKWIR